MLLSYQQCMSAPPARVFIVAIMKGVEMLTLGFILIFLMTSDGGHLFMHPNWIFKVKFWGCITYSKVLFQMCGL
jgi:hypothetical protein